MPPNARPVALIYEDSSTFQDALLTELLDKQANTDGLSKMNSDAEDWTDVKHSERKKRDRILDDGVLILLMKKSDYEGFKRLAINLSIMAVTASALASLGVGFSLATQDIPSIGTLACVLPLYMFYGFQFQCFAFAGQHEFLHRNAFKTKWINDVCLFLVGCFCFELGAHERVMHKQHHTFTNNIDKVSGRKEVPKNCCLLRALLTPFMLLCIIISNRILS
jgi:hypothetical protein